MQLGLVIRTAGEGPEVDVGRAVFWHGRDAHLAEEDEAVRSDGDADFGEVLGAKAGKLRVAQVLDGSKVFGFVLWGG
jgi:hypothetical protein